MSKLNIILCIFSILSGCAHCYVIWSFSKSGKRYIYC